MQEIQLEKLRNSVINAINRDSPLPYNPLAAFPKMARANKLGAPLTVEMDVDGFRCQGYAMGWLWALIPRWDTVTVETY